MPKQLKTDLRQLISFLASMTSDYQDILDSAMSRTVAEAALRAERKVKLRTPVVTGQLRSGWRTTPAEKVGGAYVAEIYNNVEYAAYVEYGHRAGRNGTRWVEGRFMLTQSMAELERELPAIIRRRMAEATAEWERRRGKGE